MTTLSLPLGFYNFPIAVVLLFIAYGYIVIHISQQVKYSRQIKARIKKLQ